MHISIVILLFSDQISGRGGQIASGGAPPAPCGRKPVIDIGFAKKHNISHVTDIRFARKHNIYHVTTFEWAQN